MDVIVPIICLDGIGRGQSGLSASDARREGVSLVSTLTIVGDRGLWQGAPRTSSALACKGAHGLSATAWIQSRSERLRKTYTVHTVRTVCTVQGLTRPGLDTRSERVSKTYTVHTVCTVRLDTRAARVS